MACGKYKIEQEPKFENDSEGFFSKLLKDHAFDWHKIHADQKTKLPDFHPCEGVAIEVKEFSTSTARSDHLIDHINGIREDTDYTPVAKLRRCITEKIKEIDEKFGDFSGVKLLVTYLDLEAPLMEYTGTNVRHDPKANIPYNESRLHALHNEFLDPFYKSKIDAIIVLSKENKVIGKILLKETPPADAVQSFLGKLLGTDLQFYQNLSSAIARESVTVSRIF